MSKIFHSVELLAVSVALLLAFLILFTPVIHPIELPVVATAMLIMVGWIAVSDVSHFTIPDGPLVCLAVIAAASRLVGSPGDMLSAAQETVGDGAICGGALWLLRESYFRLRGRDGIGFGDVKLAAVGGVLVGAMGFPWALFAASAVGLLLVASLSFLRPRDRIERLPFGALLAPSCWLFWLFGPWGVS